MTDVYLPFHRKYRPSKIAKYIGNEKVKKSVMSMLRGASRPQVLLFSGHAGCGKTTMARLVAKEYRCENRDEFTGACGECYSCRELEQYIESGDSGMLMNVREVDVTDSNKKQDIEEILEDAANPNFDRSWKVYILDECHVMTQSAQSRLLKTLEEPAENVLMILCTTDPDKLLPTIISRCQYQFEVTKPSRDELAGLLARVCIEEGVKYDARSLSLVCVKGEFVPRKSLIALEQVIREKGEVTYEGTVEVLDIVADKYFFKFYEFLTKDPIPVTEYVTFLGEVKESIGLKKFITDLLAFTKRGIYLNYGVSLEALDESEIKQYRRMFSKFNPIELATILDFLLNMTASVDIEAKLLLLGYTGFKNRPVENVENQDLGYLADAGKFSATDEKRQGDENYFQSITMTEEEKQAIIEDHTKEVTPDDIASMFHGVKVYTE